MFKKWCPQCVIHIGVNLRSQEKKKGVGGGGATIKSTFITSHKLTLWHSQIKTGFSASTPVIMTVHISTQIKTSFIPKHNNCCAYCSNMQLMTDQTALYKHHISAAVHAIAGSLTESDQQYGPDKLHTPHICTK